MHVTVAADFVLADHWHVVFNVASRHTRAATGAGREVNRHAPAVTNTLHGVALPEVKRRRLLAVAGVDDAVAVDVLVDGQRVALVPRRPALRLARLGEVAVEGGFLHHGITVHDRVVDLGRRQGKLCAGGLHSHVVRVVARRAVCGHGGQTKDVSANRHGLALCRLQVLSVFAGGERGASNVFTAIASTVTKRDADGAWGLTWLHEGGQLDRLAIHRHLHHRSLVALGDVGVQSHRFHVHAGHGHVVVPSDFRHGVRRLLKHGVAGLVAEPDGLLLVERQFNCTALDRGQLAQRGAHVVAQCGG